MDSTRCSICFIDKIKNLVKTSCGHEFCKSCLIEWLKTHNTCAVCRANISQKQGYYYNNICLNPLHLGDLLTNPTGSTTCLTRCRRQRVWRWLNLCKYCLPQRCHRQRVWRRLN